MYSLGAHVFLFLLFLATQKSGGEAGPCKIHYRTYTANWEIGGTLHTCTIYNVEYCKGGCVTEVKYDLHVPDSASSNRRCSTEIQQCVVTSSDWVERDLENCTPPLSGNPTAWIKVPPPGACSCNVIHGTGVSADTCENKLSKLIN
jgi:hypothetical protein